MTTSTNCCSCGASFATSSGTMTADGLKCPACSVVAPSQAHDLAGPAGPMPGKLMVVVVLFAIGIVLNLLAMSLLQVAFGVALLVGILAGNDGVRRFVMALAWINLAFGALALLLVFSSGNSMLLALAVFGVAQNVWLIWALMQEDVRDWMFKTAFKDGL